MISYIIPEDQTPKSQITGLQPEVFISPISIFSRKSIVFLKELYIGKIFYFLQKQIEEDAKNEKIKTDAILKKILSVYQILATEKIYNFVEKQLNSKTKEKIRRNIKNGKLKLRFIVEPFTNTSMENIKEAAKLIDIPLDEKVYLPDEDCWTDVEVPVGIGYYQFLEHLSEDFANIRGADVYTGLTRQPTKGKKRGGGQSISFQDITALLSLNADNCLKELLTVRSDDHNSKRQVYTQVLQTGELADMPVRTGSGGTADLFNVYVQGMGLETR